MMKEMYSLAFVVTQKMVVFQKCDYLRMEIHTRLSGKEELGLEPLNIIAQKATTFIKDQFLASNQTKMVHMITPMGNNSKGNSQWELQFQAKEHTFAHSPDIGSNLLKGNM